MTCRSIPVLFAALSFVGFARAQADSPVAAPLPPPAAPPASVFAYGKENPDCQEWTNSCQTCTRDDKGAPQCSTAGIACTPALLVCRAQAVRGKPVTP